MIVAWSAPDLQKHEHFLEIFFGIGVTFIWSVFFANDCINCAESIGITTYFIRLLLCIPGAYLVLGIALLAIVYVVRRLSALRSDSKR